MNKAKYVYYPVISFHNGNSQVIGNSYKDFTSAWEHLQNLILAQDNSIDFVGVVKVNEGVSPLERINKINDFSF